MPAAGESHLVCVNLGTGIGGAMIVNGTLLRGRFGVAGEFGHMQVVPDGRRCECGNRGCWEQYASGNALVREARELAAANSPVAHAHPGARRRRRRGDHRTADHRGRAGRRPGRAGAVRGGRQLARCRHRQPGGCSRPGHLRHRWRAVRGRRPAHRPGPRGVPAQPDRPSVPARGNDRAGAARQCGGPGRRRGPGPAVRPPVPPGPGAGSRPARPGTNRPACRDRPAADVQRRRRVARHGLAGQPDDGDGGAAP